MQVEAKHKLVIRAVIKCPEQWSNWNGKLFWSQYLIRSVHDEQSKAFHFKVDDIVSSPMQISDIWQMFIETRSVNEDFSFETVELVEQNQIWWMIHLRDRKWSAGSKYSYDSAIKSPPNDAKANPN